MPPAKPGRPPVKCDPAYPCSAVETALPSKKRKPAVPTAEVRITEPAKLQNHKVETSGLILAKKAKAQLEAVGWTVEGKTRGGMEVGLTAVRDTELLVMVWKNHVLVSSHYSLWSTDQPAQNGMPQAKLSFDPNEVGDRELVRMLSGTKVTWWNRLGSKEETAICSPTRVEVKHVYDTHGGEVPADRIITFCDPDNGGFKSFRLGALLKVGK